MTEPVKVGLDGQPATTLDPPEPVPGATEVSEAPEVPEGEEESNAE